MSETPTRFIRPLGTRCTLRREWGTCPKNDDPHLPEHEARFSFDADEVGIVRPTLPGEDDPRYEEAKFCELCGEEAPDAATRTVGWRHVYDTPSGYPEPGCLYYLGHEPANCWIGWTNCAGSHLICVLPNWHQWIIDQRASNCGLPTDTEHRCWVRHGDPEKGEPVHVDKNGETCVAGAGSILAGDWHGFLHLGVLKEV